MKISVKEEEKEEEEKLISLNIDVPSIIAKKEASFISMHSRHAFILWTVLTDSLRRRESIAAWNVAEQRESLANLGNGKHHFVNAWTTGVKTGTKGKCLFVCPNYEN